MEASNVPAHHVQSEFCTTRPAYRQGRELKAVKVYTVNQESRYIIIQGVPAVGAGQELIKLCALYGAVEEYRPLDDYPTPDNFTEVYWVKFKRIQSARFAKRKLDNHSFFGGVLHICYAPEYETVQDTREKLQERRKIIALKTKSDARGHVQSSDVPVSEEDTAASNQNSEVDLSVENPSKERRDGYQLHPSDQSSQSLVHSNSQFGIIPTQIDTPRFTLQIPPPPQVMYAGGVPSQHLPQHFNHARVPSAHSTLPHGYDPRAHNPGYQELHAPVIDSSGAFDPSTNGDTATNSKNGLSLQLIQLKNNDLHQTCEKISNNSQARDLHGGVAKVPKDLSEQKGRNSSAVVKKFKKSGAPPRFVPRQAEAALKRKQQEGDVLGTDKLASEIRRNAVSLRDKVQGPTLPNGGMKTSASSSPLEASVGKTVTEIRQKISQFSEGYPCKKKLKKS